MKAILVKSDKGLRGSTPADHDAWTKFRRRLDLMPVGAWVRVEWARPRHGKHHRKLFALLAMVVDNSEIYDTTEKALIAIKLVTGYAEPVIDPRTGELAQVPKSIAYESMAQDEFEIFYQAAIDGVIRHILPQLNRKTADRLVEQIILEWC